MGLGDSLLNPSYIPDLPTPGSDKADIPYYSGKFIKCPVKFTDDMLEFLESDEYMGLELRPIQRQIIEDLFYTNREDGLPMYREAVVLSGMRSGKSAVASFICAGMTHDMLKYDDPAAHFGQMQGYQLTAQFVATSEEQSKQTAYSSFESIIMGNPWWKKYIQYLRDRESADSKRQQYFQHLSRSIWFREKNIIIKSLHSNSASLAGMTSYLVVFDEMSRFAVSENEIQGETESRTAQAVYNTSQRSAASLSPYSRVLTVTSPLYERDYGMQLFYQAGTVRTGENEKETTYLRKKHKPKNGTNSNIIAYHFTTFEFAPLTVNKHGKRSGVDPNEFLTYKNTQPTAYKRDFLAIPPGAENPFFEFPERIDLCISPESSRFHFVDKIIEDSVVKDGLVEIRSYIAKDMYVDHSDMMKRYIVCVDQGETRDRFVVAMGHIEDYSQVPDARVPYKIKIDFVEPWIPDKANKVTVSFQNVEHVIAALANRFNIIRVTYDQWQSVESIQRLFSQGIYSTKLEISTTMYEEFKRMIYNGIVEIPNSDMLVSEMRQLNLIRGKTVDHSQGNYKDMSDAVCRVVYSCYNDYLEAAANGEPMLGQTIHMPTIKSVADMYSQQHSEMVSALNGSAGASDIFGDKSFYIPRRPKDGPQKHNLNFNNFFK